MRERLAALKKELGFANYNALLSYAIIELTRGAAIPPAEYSIVFERLKTKPAIITGESGSGKTTSVRALLSRWPGSVFVLDVTDEYSKEDPPFMKVDLGEIFSMDWTRGTRRIRFVTNQKSKDAARGEASAIFGHLNYLKNVGALREWVLVIEEGHNFAQDANLRALLIEGRKFARKVILVTTDWRVYEGIARVFRPLAWQEEPGLIAGPLSASLAGP